MQSITADPLGSAHGGYAPAIAVSADRVARVPDELSDEAAAQVEPATVAYHGVRLSRLRLGDVVAVLGAGPIGLFTMQWVRAAGASRVVVVEGSPTRAALAGDLGADAVTAPGEEAADAVAVASGGLGADVVFECAGVPEAIQGAVDLARRGGSVAIIGLADRPASITPVTWLARELTVTSSLGYHQAEFARSMAMMAAGRVLADPLHTRTVGPGALHDAMADLAGGAPDDVKILFSPDA
jgi:(R,R)-butanediol dehydrogenase/meso-butanediol dehydrogenase/diacetyl reductase